MKRKEFKIAINANKETVWNTLWNCETYPEWTASFCEGSHAETDWKEGGEVKFLGPDGNGMLSKIVKNEPHNKIYFEHQGIVKDGEKILDSAEAKKWKGAIENYDLKEKEGNTHMQVTTDIAPEYEEEFDKSWPKALQKVKELSEK